MENEKVPVLDISTPMVILINGIGFKSFTEGFDKPFDEIIIKTMQDTMLYLCENTKNCVFGYTWSDKIILMIYEPMHVWSETDSQKRCSRASSVATMSFNAYFAENVDILYEELYGNKPYTNDNKYSNSVFGSPYIVGWHDHLVSNHLICKKAMFNSRINRLPKDRVNNYFKLWQETAIKTSIAEAASALDMNWDTIPSYIQYGSCCIKVPSEEAGNALLADLSSYLKYSSCCIKTPEERWIIDENIPLFSENPDYLNNIIRMMK